jgi:hypothetical protein
LDRLTAAVENGEPFVGTKIGTKRSPTFDADVVRKLFLGAKADCGVQIESVTIAGLLNLRDARATSGGPCTALILRDCILEGANGESASGSPGIDASHSHLQRLSLVDCQTDGVELSSAVIVSDLELDRLHPPERDDAERSHDADRTDGGKRGTCWVRACGVRIGGSLTASGANLSLPWQDGAPDVPWPPGDAERYWQNLAGEYGLDLDGARIDGSLVLGPGFESVGGVRVRGATIGGRFYIDASDALLERVDATTLRIGGDLKVSGSVSYADLSGSIIDGQVALGDDERAGEATPLVITSVNGSQPVFKLSDGRVGRDLQVTRVVTKTRVSIDWRTRPLRIRTFKLACYPGWFLGEALLRPTSGSGLAILAFMFGPWEEEEDIILPLDGRSDAIHFLNHHGRHKLETPEQAVEYLTLFCTHVWGDEGAFRIDPESIVLTPGESSDTWSATATIEYGSNLFEADLSIQRRTETRRSPSTAEPEIVKRSGDVEMTDDRPLHPMPHDRARRAYASPVRWFEVLPDPSADGRPAAEVPDWPEGPPPLGAETDWSDMSPEGDGQAIWEALRPQVQANLTPPTTKQWPTGWQRPKAILEGLKVASLNDSDGLNWFDLKWPPDEDADTEDAETEDAETAEAETEHAKPETLHELLEEAGPPTLHLFLSGFEYDRIRDRRDAVRSSASEGILPGARARSRSRRLLLFLRKVGMTLLRGAGTVVSTLRDFVVLLPKPRSFRKKLRSLFESEGVERKRLEARCYWLKSQYEEDPPTEDEYRPQPYQQLARVWRAAGHFEAADDITFVKLELEKVRLSRSNLSPWHRMVQWTRQRARHWFDQIPFGFGLKPSRAVITLVLFWLFGVFAIWGLSEAWLKVDASAVATVVSGEGVRERVVIEEAPVAEPREEISCGDHINELVYPIDVMIPLIDLRQESRCHFTIKNWWLGVGHGAYAILGWLVIYRLIFTLSGIVRRQTER